VVVVLAAVTAVVLVLFAAGSASAAKRPAASAARSGSMTLAIIIPATNNNLAKAHVSVMFTSGFARIDHITASTLADDSPLDLLNVDANPTVGFTIDTEGEHFATDIYSLAITGPLTGAPIAGNASLPMGASIHVGIAGGKGPPGAVIKDGPFSFPSPPDEISSPPPTGKASLKINPQRVRAGRAVRVSGNVGGRCAGGGIVAVRSRAFIARTPLGGVPAIFAVVGSNGSFSARTRIPAGRKPGRYQVTGRCLGHGGLGLIRRVRVLRK
jgi:hypothetical protein